LLPSMACASDWVALAKTPEARVMLDRQSVEILGSEAKATLKFLYHNKQPGQTVTLGKPFDSSVNQYYLDCVTKRFQVLELTLFHDNDIVGTFHANLDRNNFLEPKLGTGVMFLLDKVCKSNKAGSATLKN
jgi:hypothetical protein